MPTVRINHDGFEIDATYLAEYFHLDPAEVPHLLRDQRIKARCERGQGEDVGRHRLSFRFGASTLNLIIDGNGEVLRRTSLFWPSR